MRVAVAVAGSLLFVVSLAYGAWSYVGRFGADAPEISAAGRGARVGFNLLLFTLFALHHSAFARTGLRERVARLVSPPLERSAYVWLSSLLFLGVMASWQPVGGVAWRATGSLAWLLVAVQLAGLAVTLTAASALDVLSLSGLRQALGQMPSGPTPLLETGLYRLVRHPVYLGWVLMVWATPAMTGTRLVFAAVSTAYLVAAIPLEERSLRREFGEEYEGYARRVRWRVIWGVY
jgi:protein-S-isoprenylcysteine O-methyltransferase Ste14